MTEHPNTSAQQGRARSAHTCSVPVAGRLVFGWSPARSYANASVFGDALVCVGRRKFLITAKLVERFGIDPDALTEDVAS